MIFIIVPYLRQNSIEVSVIKMNFRERSGKTSVGAKVKQDFNLSVADDIRQSIGKRYPY